MPRLNRGRAGHSAPWTDSEEVPSPAFRLYNKGPELQESAI